MQQSETHIRTEHVPRDYVDKLNRAIDDLHSFEAENGRLATQNALMEQRNLELQLLVGKLQQQNNERAPNGSGP